MGVKLGVTTFLCTTLLSRCDFYKGLNQGNTTYHAQLYLKEPFSEPTVGSDDLLAPLALVECSRLHPVLRYLMLEALGILVPCDGLIGRGPSAGTLVMLDPLDLIRVLLNLLGMNLVIPTCIILVQTYW
jgi:hypothetical protein